MTTNKRNKKDELKIVQENASKMEKGAKYEAMFKQAQSFVQTRQDDIAENVAFYQGDQYKLPKYVDDKPWVIDMNVPHSTVAIQTRVASLNANDYVGELQAYSPEDTEAVESVSSLYLDYWEEMNIDDIINKSIEKAAVSREAYCHIVADANDVVGGNGNKRKGSFKAYLLDTASVWLDPKARNFDTCDYIFITSRMSKKQALNTYPELKGDDVVLSYNDSPKERGEIYVGNDYTTAQDDVVTKLIMYEKMYSNRKTKIMRRTLVGGFLVEEKEIKGLTRFPIAQLLWQSVEQSAYGLSLMDQLKPLQKAINSIESAITNTALAYSSPSVIVSKSSGINPVAVAKTIGAPGVVYHSNGNPNEAMASALTRVIDSSLMEIRNQYIHDINIIAGISGSFTGSLGTSGNTEGGSQIAVERAKVIENIILQNVSDYVEQITRILVSYLSYVFAGDDNIQTRKTEPTTGKVTWNRRSLPESVSNLNWSFFIDLSPRTKYAKITEQKTIKDLFQMQNQYDTPVKLLTFLDVLNTTSLRNMDELRERYHRISSQNAQSKVELISEIDAIATKYEIPSSLVTQAKVEVLQNEDKMPTLDQIMQYAEQMKAQMEAQIQQSNQEAQAMGLSEEAIQAAQAKVKDMKPSDLGIQK